VWKEEEEEEERKKEREKLNCMNKTA
jgi:hypothetical protein